MFLRLFDREMIAMTIVVVAAAIIAVILMTYGGAATFAVWYVDVRWASLGAGSLVFLAGFAFGGMMSDRVTWQYRQISVPEKHTGNILLAAAGVAAGTVYTNLAWVIIPICLICGMVFGWTAMVAIDRRALARQAARNESMRSIIK